MNNTKEKIQTMFGWVSDFKLNLHYKISSILHAPKMLYYKIRNYQKWVRFGECFGKRTDVIWYLSRPLTLTFMTEDEGYCPTCHERAVENGEAENNDWHKFEHADYVHCYETNLLLSNKKYTYTSCTCEDLLFEPLDDYYESGGERGSCLFTQSCAQWDINKDIRSKKPDPLSQHKAQLLPSDWRRS